MPSLAKRSAMPRPNPDDAPVITTVRFLPLLFFIVATLPNSYEQPDRSGHQNVMKCAKAYAESCGVEQ